MTNNRSSQDEEIIRRLESLKNDGREYPPDLLEKRRNSYNKATRGLIVGVPAGGILKGLLHSLPHTGEAILKTVLISALVVEAGVSAYVFRNEIRDWLVGTEAPTVVVSPYVIQPTITSTATFTPTSTPTETATLLEPTKKPHPTDQGLHLGQTKTPEP